MKTTTMTDTAGIITDYDDAKEFVFACNLKFQKYLKPTEGYPGSRYDQIARMLQYGRIENDRDLAVVEAVFGLRIEREVPWDRRRVTSPRSIEYIKRFENPLLTRAFATLKKMQRNIHLFREEIDLLPDAISEDSDDDIRAQCGATYLARVAQVRAKWPDLAHRLNRVKAYVERLRSAIELIQEACLCPDGLASEIAASREFLKYEDAPPLPLYLAPKFADRDHQRRLAKRRQQYAARKKEADWRRQAKRQEPPAR